MLKRYPFSRNRNDLHSSFKCTCPSPLFANQPELGIKHTITVTGYHDVNFFDNVNAGARGGMCRCGREYRTQWFRDGVTFEFVDGGEVVHVR